MAERGVTVSREAIRLWCIKFAAVYTRRLKRKHRGYGDTVGALWLPLQPILPPSLTVR